MKRERRNLYRSRFPSWISSLISENVQARILAESSQTLEEQISIIDVLTSRSGELSKDVQARLFDESNRTLEEQISVYPRMFKHES